MVTNMTAGRHGAGEVAKSYILIFRQEETDREREREAERDTERERERERERQRQRQKIVTGPGYMDF